MVLLQHREFNSIHQIISMKSYIYIIYIYSLHVSIIYMSLHPTAVQALKTCHICKSPLELKI